MFHSQPYFWKGSYQTPGAFRDAVHRILPSHLTHRDLFFFCVGTDKATGDCLGPLVGHLLAKKGYTNVVGTVYDPVHALNMQEKIKHLPPNKVVLAIDACLGRVENIGHIEIRKGSLHPGESMKKGLPDMGDYTIQGVVNAQGLGDGAVLFNTRLSLVMDMAEVIAETLMERFPKEG